ncbi:MAG: hypothetical protein ACMUIU_18960 [bacterium]
MVIFAGIEVPFFDNGFGDGYKVLARKTGSIIITNILKGILGHPDLRSDRIDPNSDGYTIMAKQFYKALRPYF